MKKYQDFMKQESLLQFMQSTARSCGEKSLVKTPAINSTVGVTQVSTMIKSAKKRSKVNHGSFKAFHLPHGLQISKREWFLVFL